jgi:hypothetical protein
MLFLIMVRRKKDPDFAESGSGWRIRSFQDHKWKTFLLNKNYSEGLQAPE